MLKGHDLICIGAVDWFGIRNRSQQLMERFSKNNRILYVNPPVSWLAPLRNPKLLEKRIAWKQGPLSVADNIWVMDLPPAIPFASQLPGVNAVNQKRLGAFIRKAALSLGYARPILWTYLHTSADLLGTLDEALVIYDCVDEHGAFPGYDPKVVAAMEDRLLGQADIVFASARELYHKRQDKAREIHLVPNGAELAHFARAVTDNLPVPADMQSITAPTVGYIGYIHKWVNLEWMHAAAVARPDWAFVMIGPVHTDMGALAHMQNVHLLGEKAYAQLPAYLQRFSVCTIPFIRNALTISVNPIKLYEYLAAGRPVVASRIPELEEFSDVIALTESAVEFIQALDAQMTKNSPADIQTRQVRVQNHSWDHRFRAMEEIIEQRMRNQDE